MLFILFLSISTFVAFLLFLMCRKCFHFSWSVLACFFFFKQKTAYEMRISDWSSDVCSSDLEDVEQLLAWEMNLLHQPDVAQIAGATRSVRDYLLEKLEDRRKNPRDDFISFAANAKIDGRPLSLDEQVGIAFNLYTGGLDNVSTNIGLHFRHIAERQDHQAYLREHPDMIPLATEEFLRDYAAVTTFRICVKEIEIAGVRVMPGDRVAMSTTLAWRDEGKYDKPNEVRLDRGPSHDSFAHGPHRCVGMHLARRELHAAIEEFLKAVPTFHIAPGAEIVSTLGPIIQPETLPLVWEKV